MSLLFLLLALTSAFGSYSCFQMTEDSARDISWILAGISVLFAGSSLAVFPWSKAKERDRLTPRQSAEIQRLGELLKQDMINQGIEITPENDPTNTKNVAEAVEKDLTAQGIEIPRENNPAASPKD